MYCKYCGEQNPDHAMFCKKCGKKLNEEKKADPVMKDGMGYSSNIPESPKKSIKVRPSVVVIIAAVLIVIVAATQLFGGRSYKKTVDMFITSIMQGDGKTLLKVIPEDLIEYGMKEDGITSRTALEEELEDAIGNPEESLKEVYGDDWSYSYKIVDTENFTSDELKDLKEEYHTELPDMKIKAAKRITIELSVKLGDEEEQSDTIDFSLIKIGRSWYIDFSSVGSIF